MKSAVMKSAVKIIGVVIGLAVLSLAGCTPKSQQPDHSGMPDAPAYKGGDSKEAPKPDAKPDSTTSSETGDAEQIITLALAKLPEEDRKLAEAQRDCPITGERLGAMDKPVKITLDGQVVFLCCAGCKDAAEDDPAGTIAKLKK